MVRFSSLLFLIACVGQLFSQTTTYQISVIEATLYDQPIDDAKALMKLSFGEEVKVGKFVKGDSWASVIYKGTAGYILSSQLKVASGGEKERVDIQKYHVIAYEAKLYATASESSGVLSTCKLGTEVGYISDDGDWAKVKLGSKVGYLKTRFIRPGAYNQKAAEAAKKDKEESTAMSETWVVKVPTADLKVKPDVNAGVLSTLNNGTEVLVVGKVNGDKWAKIRYNNAIGYMSFRFLKRFSNDPPPPKEAKRIGAVCRDGKVMPRTGRKACEKHGGVLRWVYKQQ